jgi:hypothetical protein
VFHQSDPAPRPSRSLPITITILSILLWAALVAISQAFVVFSQPVTGEGAEYLLMVLVKYYPLVALGALAVGLLLGDARGYLAVIATSLPPLLLGLLVLQMFLSHDVDWDTYENAEQEAFMRASAFGSARDIRERVAAGANPDMAGQNGNNPLLVAYRRDNRDTFAALLEAGADPNVLPRDGTQHNIAFAIIEDLDDTGRRRKYFELLLPHSSTESMEDAAGMLEEHNRRQHVIGDRARREELIRQLQARGIDFDAAFARLEAERTERLERAVPSAADQ